MFVSTSGSDSGYSIANSLRMRSSASAYLSRTPSASNRKTWTWSGLVKRGSLGSDQTLLSAGTTGPMGTINFDANDKLRFYTTNSTVSASESVTTSAVFRDPSAHYHVIFAIDTTQATYADRVKIYINGVQQAVTVTNQNTIITLNADLHVNRAEAHNIGRYVYSPGQYLDGYLSDVYFIDGQALTPSSFGQTDTNGVWVPKAYSGTYGTNGFYLKFNDGSSTTNLCLDRSGNGNNWTPTNISVTAGATYDWMNDSPTQNYAVLNPLENTNVTYLGFQYANLRANMGTGAQTMCFGTVVLPTDKWYWEIVVTTASNGIGLGISYGSNTVTDGNNKGVIYGGGGGKRVLTVDSAYGASYTTGDVIGIAVDKAAGTVTFYKNNVSQGVISEATIATQDYRPMIHNNTSSGSGLYDANFGQRPFTYTPPTGFKALCTSNLPAVTITAPKKHFDVVTWNANVANPTAGQKSIVVGFQPDLIWSKARGAAESHYLADVLRGFNDGSKWLRSSATTAEGADAVGSSTARYNPTSAGFDIIDTDYNTGEVYFNARDYIGWTWKAGGAGVTNTAGSITSTVSANTAAGFSIVTATAPASGAFTMGHGLSTAPKLVITKPRGRAVSWMTYHAGLNSGSPGTSWYLYLDQTAAQASFANVWGTAGITSSVVGMQVGASCAASDTLLLYCFAEVPGFSKFGSLVANASADNVFTYTGFDIGLLMIKCSSTTGNWVMIDTVRQTYNVQGPTLLSNTSGAEVANVYVDFVANGFKIRSSGADIGAAQTYVYAAFARSPFGGSNVAPATAR